MMIEIRVVRETKPKWKGERKSGRRGTVVRKISVLGHKRSVLFRVNPYTAPFFLFKFLLDLGHLLMCITMTRCCSDAALSIPKSGVVRV